MKSVLQDWVMNIGIRQQGTPEDMKKRLEAPEEKFAEQEDDV